MESRGLKKISRQKTSLQGQKVKIVATFKHLDSAVTMGGGGGGGGGGVEAEVAYMEIKWEAKGESAQDSK